MGKKSAKGSARARRYENRMARSLDRLADLESFAEMFLPAIRGDLKSGMSADEIYDKYKSIAAARVATIVVSEIDSSKALTAAKELLDRSGGKAAEKKEVTHKYERLKDEELDSLLLTEASDMSGGSDEDLPN